MMRRAVTIALAAGTLSAAAALPVQAKTQVCPGPVMLDGIDVSYWQQNIDWAKVKAAGKKYAIMRATHAMKVDTKFDFNWKECHAKGLHCGVYQYFEPAEDPIVQADLMLGMMGKLQPGDLPPVIDVESTTGANPTQLATAVTKWIAHVEKATGVKPIIYSGAYFWEGNVKSNAFAAYPLWHPQYTTASCPTIASPWTNWHFWQHSSTGSVSGISGNVDLNRWNGTAADLAGFAIQATAGCTPGCQGNVAVQASCAKTDCAANKCVSDSLGVRCIDASCPATGKAKVCLPSGLLGDCDNGKLSATSDCSATGGLCNSAAASQAKCVSAFCVSSASAKPQVKDICLKDGKRYTCSAAGDLSLKECPAGGSCTDDGSGAVCKSKTCAKSCQGDLLVGADCGKIDCAGLPGLQAGSCVSDAKGPRCSSSFCPPLGTTTVCLPKISPAAMGICTDGSLVPATCKVGLETCVAVAGGTQCQAQATADAQVGDTDPGLDSATADDLSPSEDATPSDGLAGDGPAGDGTLSGGDSAGAAANLLISPKDEGGCNANPSGNADGWLGLVLAAAALALARRKELES
jgi:lysozyme